LKSLDFFRISRKLPHSLPQRALASAG